jgi:hypothetical protein
LDLRCTTIAEFRQVVGAQDVEHLDQADASRGGRRRAEYLVTVIGAFYGHAFLDLIVRKIGFRD